MHLDHRPFVVSPNEMGRAARNDENGAGKKYLALRLVRAVEGRAELASQDRHHFRVGKRVERELGSGCEPHLFDVGLVLRDIADEHCKLETATDISPDDLIRQNDEPGVFGKGDGGKAQT
jgi:hypothetical protein